MATSNTLPTSNVGGNNQTSPGVGGLSTRPQPIFQSPIQGGTLPTNNPYLSSLNPTSVYTPSTSGSIGGSTIAPGGTATYNPATSSGYGPGVSNLDKQLTDIYGKGVGGSLNYLLQNMSGIDSGIFQQWLAAQGPANAQAQANLNQGLGVAGIGANSSVAGLANANLQSNFAAQAALENANLMTQNIQDTMNILQNTQGAAAKEVAQSGWTVFGDVMGNIAQDVGAVLHGGPGALPGSTAGAGAGATDPLNQGQWGTTGYAPTIQPNAPSIDTIPTESFTPPDVSVFGGG